MAAKTYIGVGDTMANEEVSNNGRLPNGQYAKGNIGGPGNSQGAYQERFRAILNKCVSKKAFKELCKKVLADALAGNPHAQKLLFGRLLGKEAQQIILDAGPIKFYELTKQEEEAV